MWNKRQAADAEDPNAARIEERLARLETLLLRLSEQKPETHIHIEQLHIQEAVLESMTVRLDSLDVEEISGSLNIGNNFHTLKGEPVKPKSLDDLKKKQPGEEKPSKEKPSKEKQYRTSGRNPYNIKESQKTSPESSEANGSSVYRTPSGYSFRFDREKGGR